MNQHNQADKHSSNSDSIFRNANDFGMCSLSCTRHSKDKTQDPSISPCIPTLLHRKVFLTDAKIQQFGGGGGEKNEEEKNITKAFKKGVSLFH